MKIFLFALNMLALDQRATIQDLTLVLEILNQFVYHPEILVLLKII